MTGTQHRRRVGTVRPSHLMFTGGVGALIDLPNFPVLVRGLDDWRFDTVPDWTPLYEPRLLAAVGKLLGAPVAELRPPPWMDGFDAEPNGPAGRVGVPVIPFPQWLRCTACNRLAPLDSGNWGFLNDKARRPDEARFFHQDCPRRRRQPLAVAARFVLACVNGHLDDFPYREFVHGGGACPEVSHPQLQMEDYGGNRGANVVIRCPSCGAKRNINQATGQRGIQNLPACRGRHPHLGTFDRMPGAADGAGRRRVQPVVRADPVRAGRAAGRRQRAADEGRAVVERPAERAGARRAGLRLDPARRSRPCTSGARTRSSRPSPSTARRWSQDREATSRPIPICVRPSGRFSPRRYRPSRPTTSPSAVTTTACRPRSPGSFPTSHRPNGCARCGR